jgi:hypothetical protein
LDKESREGCEGDDNRRRRWVARFQAHRRPRQTNPGKIEIPSGGLGASHVELLLELSQPLEGNTMQLFESSCVRYAGI